MGDRFARLARLAVRGANVQAGQTVLVDVDLGHERLARAIAEAAYEAGARFVDVQYFDPYLKRARVELGEPDTLGHVPPWLGERVLAHAAEHGAHIRPSGVTAPNVLAGLDPALAGRDMLPRVKELGRVVSERATNWCIVPAPHRAWARLVHPDLPEDEAYERLWDELEHVLRLDEPDPEAAWEGRLGALSEIARRLAEQRLDAISMRGPGTELTIGLLPSQRWCAADFTTVSGIRHFPNLPTEEVFTTTDRRRADGHVTATTPLVLRDGTIVRGLRVRFEDGRCVELGADENGEALRAQLELDDGGLRLGEVALVDRHGRIGPLGTVFYNTLLDENAASHIAFGRGFPFLVDAEDAAEVNESGTHVDFMVGSPELEVDGLTRDGRRIPVLRGGDWQL